MAVQDRYKAYVSDQHQFFDELITEDWDTYRSDTWDATRRFEIKTIFDIIQPVSIIDVGCGCGFHDKEMAQYPFVKSIDAVDPSGASVATAERHFPHAKVARWKSRFDELPDLAKYDFSVSFQLFEHLEHPEIYLEKMKRITMRGGYVGIVMPNRMRLSNRVRSLRGLKPEFLDVMHFREYSIKETESIGKSCGLRPFRSFGYNLYGHPWVDRLTHAAKLNIGKLFPSIAHGICVIFANP